MENHQNHKGEGEEEPDIEKSQHRQQQAWGTWEELLLACAVNRHGFKDWDAVAMEVQSRTTARFLTTARHCEQKFNDLSHRFNDGSPPPQQNGAAGGGGDDNSDHVPWLDQLRKLRVAELRREVQRRDDSILTLQLEVKRLEEEKAKENDGKEDEKPDLAVSGEARPENDKTGGEVEEAGPANSEPEERTENADKSLPTTGDESDRENQSVNESNSTGSRFEKTGEGDKKTGIGPAPVQTGSQEPNPVTRKPVEEESNNGSYDALAKVPTCESVPPSEERKVEEEDDDSSELHDSVAHSGEGATRESSEVQSSASLTRKRKSRRRKDLSGGDGRGGGTSSPQENEEVAMVKSEPLAVVLELIKGHEHSSLFERRLESQDSDGYKDIVKQPLDLETIQLRLQKGHYASCTSAFFRDLLLLFTNATVFFPHDSTEAQAARQLHHLVTAEIKNHGQAQSDPIPRKNDSVPPNASLAKPDSLLSKNKASGPILVCRKRSSMSAKPSSSTFGHKGDQPIFNDKKERPSSDAKTPIKPSSDTDEEEIPKAKEKPVTGARSLRRSSNKNINNKKLSANSTPKAGSSGNKPLETLKPEKSKAEAAPDKKRSAAADFLKRIKRNTSAEASKGSGGSGGGGGGGSSSSSKGAGGGNGSKEHKKVVNNGKGEKGKERVSRHNVGGGSGSGDKRNKNVENNSQSKRSVGRPPKKAAESNAGSKRGRESSASAGKDKRPKKRSKK